MKEILARINLPEALAVDAELKFGIEDAIKDSLDTLMELLAKNRADRRDIWTAIGKEVEKEFPELDEEKHLMHYDWKLQIVKIEKR